MIRLKTTNHIYGLVATKTYSSGPHGTSHLVFIKLKKYDTKLYYNKSSDDFEEVIVEGNKRNHLNPRVFCSIVRTNSCFDQGNGTGGLSTIHRIV